MPNRDTFFKIFRRCKFHANCQENTKIALKNLTAMIRVTRAGVSPDANDSLMQQECSCGCIFSTWQLCGFSTARAIPQLIRYFSAVSRIASGLLLKLQEFSGRSKVKDRGRLPVAIVIVIIARRTSVAWGKKAWQRLLRKLDRQGHIDHEESFADGTSSLAKPHIYSFNEMSCHSEFVGDSVVSLAWRSRHVDLLGLFSLLYKIYVWLWYFHNYIYILIYQ
jgi:hypothetical protein